MRDAAKDLHDMYAELSSETLRARLAQLEQENTLGAGARALCIEAVLADRESWTTKYPQSAVLKPGTVFPVQPLSTNSVHYETCPRCGAKPSFLCVTPSGRRGSGLTGGAHAERMDALSRNRSDIADRSRITL